MNWQELGAATQKERHYVIKPSGFSELAWGSRGVSVGHDLPQHEWTAAIDSALKLSHRLLMCFKNFTRAGNTTSIILTQLTRRYGRWRDAPGCHPIIS